MKKIYIILFFFIISVVFSSCEDSNNEHEEEVIRATGSYRSEGIDKSVWGDFELILELNKSEYKTQEDISVKLYFSNIGNIDITFPAIVPVNNMISPPKINIWSDNIRIIVDEFAESLDTGSESRIEINENLMLIDVNLLDIEGLFWKKSNSWEQEEGNISEQLSTGTYFASASFSTEIIYSSFTDTLSFQIE